MNYHNDNREHRRSYVCLDIEMLERTEDYQRYVRLDPRPAKLRWPFRSTCAAALLSFTVDDNGTFEFDGMQSWSGDDERTLLKAIFDKLLEQPDHQLVTWGGLNMDLPVLRICAARHGLRLPKQLVHNAREHRQRLHLDLCKELEAGSGCHVHMSEVAMSLNLPVKFADRASCVPQLLAEGKLQRLRQIPIADVISTALILQSHLESHGELVSAKAAQIVTLRKASRRLPDPRHADYLVRVEQRLCREVMAEAQAFIADAA